MDGLDWLFVIFGSVMALMIFMIWSGGRNPDKGTKLGNFVDDLVWAPIKAIYDLFVVLGPTIKFILGFLVVGVILTFCGIGLPLRVQ